MKVRGTRTVVSLLLTTALAAGCGQGVEAPGEFTEEVASRRAELSVVRGSTIQATEGVNLRTGPGTTYAVILTVPLGKTATVLNPTPSNGFYQVNYQGNVGWTSGAYWQVVAGLWVNGYQLNANEDRWLRWVAQNTVPRLSGTRDTRLTVSSRVAWWSLKEGVLGLTNPIPFSNCNTTSGDVRIGPLDVCAAGRAWQVGISGIQVPNVTMTQAQNTRATLYPTLTEGQVLGETAVQAGYAAGTSTYNSIVNSTGDLRKSWLLRNHAIGFTLQEPFVTRECISATTNGWCYGTGWTSTARYAPNYTESMESIREIRATLDGLAP